MLAEAEITDHAVPTADGLMLATTSYRPAAAGRYPVLLIRTPYDRRKLRAEGVAWAQHGLCLLAQDVRGRYDSDGSWQPYRHERTDARFTLRWLDRQDWYSGKLATKGASYGAYTAMLAADWLDSPVAAVISYVPVLGHREVSRHDNGPLLLESLIWWHLHHSDRRERAPQQGWRRRCRDRLQSFEGAARPVAELGRLFGFDESAWFDDVANADDTAETAAASLLLENPRTADGLPASDHDRSAHPEGITAAMLQVGGWYDPFVARSLESFNRTGAAERRVVIGPWTHQLRTPAALQQLYPGAGRFDFAELERRFLQEHLELDAPAPSPELTPRPAIRDHNLRSRPVLYLELGTGRWRDATAWPPHLETTEFRLSRPSSESAGRLVHSAAGRTDSLTQPPIGPYTRQFADAASSSVVSDPSSPVPSRIGPMPRADIERRRDVLCFTTDRLRLPVRLAGAASARLWVSATAMDDSTRVSADVVVHLVRVGADESTLWLAHGVQRVLFDGSDTLRLEVQLTPIASQIPIDARLRLEIAGSCFPFYDLAGPKARLTVWHDSRHPSSLLLPASDPSAANRPSTLERAQ